MSDYKVEHWSRGKTCSAENSMAPMVVPVNNRAATRQAIIDALARQGYALIERSSWHAQPTHGGMRESNWDYKDIVIHHAGRSYSCGAPSMAQIQRAQADDMNRSVAFSDVGYHYAISCQGEIYEARDIRFIGEHVGGGNTGKIGVVFLADFVQAGEAYYQEYRGLSILEKVRNIREIVTDQVIVRHDKPTESQLEAALVLSRVLADYFGICRLGGHREYQMLVNKKGRACPGNWGMSIVKSIRAQLGLSEPGSDGS
ncbi:peptidoglycan recognition protein family protein [Burkholderia sp. 3C]